MEQSKSQHILELVNELLDDIELSRIPAEALLLKTSRLARLVGSNEIRKWLNFEMKGYNFEDSVSLKYLDIVNRWADKKEGVAYIMPLPELEAKINAEKTKLETIKPADTSGDWGFRIAQMYEANIDNTKQMITLLSGIRSKVLAQLHDFITQIYYEKQFDSLTESIFENYKSDIDSLISQNCGDVLEQIPSVMARLSDKDSESISQALTTVRRIIDSFADSIYPPTDKTITIEGNEIKLDAGKHQNRINAFVHEHIDSKSRKRKIRQNLSNLYDRVSTGVHKDVLEEEAKSLFLNTYLLLGEILHIKK